MKITYCGDYEEMSALAATFTFNVLLEKKNLLLCAATGNSPTGLYSKLVEKIGNDRSLNREIRIIKLDEWGGVPENHEVTCERYLQKHVLEPLNIREEKYISFKSDPVDPNDECIRIQTELEREGPIDVCILGVGKNGHIGFNEPGKSLHLHCHYAKLTEASLSHTMVERMRQKPSYGMTLGMKDILDSRLIILLITGNQKADIRKKLLDEKVRTDLPASFLWLHPNVECLIDQSYV